MNMEYQTYCRITKKMNNQIFDLEHEIQSVIKIKKRIPSISLKEWMRFIKISKYFLNASSINKKIEEIKKI